MDAKKRTEKNLGSRDWQRRLAKEGKGKGIPCACGCGQLTNLRHRRPSRFVSGHNGRTHGLAAKRRDGVAGASTEYNLLNKYGLTLVEHEAMVKAQGGRCLLCDKKPKRLVVDHCHESGKVRGLLCTRCNLNLAPIEDPLFFPRALVYLGKQKED